MSKQVELEIKCDCGASYVAKLYRTLWIELPENRDLVFSDRVNRVQCDRCGLAIHVPLALLCTNSGSNIAVWYEPIPDSQIDQDALMYAKVQGPDSFLATAPRIADWEEFKDTILQFESGELVGKSARPLDRNALAHLAESMNQKREKTAREGFLSRIAKSLRGSRGSKG